MNPEYFETLLASLVGQEITYTCDISDGPFTTKLVEVGDDYVVFGEGKNQFTMRIECISTFAPANPGLRSVP